MPNILFWHQGAKLIFLFIISTKGMLPSGINPQNLHPIEFDYRSESLSQRGNMLQNWGC